ncbi:uncharacterized protein LOC111710420 isoform X2 [Eurytemora carolleeae]|uniref:uncharacterized protein LOC111710420 isoform X2 n=1 Tax=Eurytemora carolleeae TaxID=1294199 RepID=UPI000C781E2A|nr:uncharacterized protein LOC111710420 isoform X2 [Eurytemora carolleeae]|eukprot:XP_023340272.1 uncharacterized protein LOC111710420 isoform X2 [Eurytemora affinis]
MILGILLIFCITHCYGFNTCSDFQEGSCPLSELNIISIVNQIQTPGLCQDVCRSNSDCIFFTHSGDQCFLLRGCGSIENCQGCVSGPPSPDFDTCPWPPGPTTSTPEETTTTTLSSTSKPTTTTTMSTESTTSTVDCTEFFPGYICSDSELDHVEHIVSRLECQTLCQLVYCICQLICYI